MGGFETRPYKKWADFVEKICVITLKTHVFWVFCDILKAAKGDTKSMDIVKNEESAFLAK
jgi:hypothetical protein